MKTTVQRGTALEYLTVYPDDFVKGRPYPLILCLHGFGANMHDLADLAPLISSTGYVYVYVFPNGPVAAVDEPKMRAWHERGGNESQGAVREALDALDGLVKEVTARFNVGPGRSLLLGFSQGGAMALRYGLPRPDLFAGIAVLSGSLRRVEDLQANLPRDRKQTIFIAHGEFDSLVLVEWSERLVEFLEEQGYHPVYKTYSIDHEISPDEVRDLREWVKKVLPVGSSE